MSRRNMRAVCAGLVSIALAGAVFTAGAAKKGDPDSRSGHGQSADQRLVKNPERPAGCVSNVQVTVNQATGEKSYSCRGQDGMVKSVPPPAGK